MTNQIYKVKGTLQYITTVVVMWTISPFFSFIYDGYPGSAWRE